MASIEHLSVLEQIRDFFGVGRIFTTATSATYRVTKMADLLNVIVPHFTNYPLISNKWVTYTLWVRCLNIIKTGAHNTSQGLHNLLSIYAAMNRGPSKTVQEHFPNLVPVTLPVYTKMFTELHPWWVTGYCTLWAIFDCGIKTSYTPILDTGNGDVRGGIPYQTLFHSFSFSRLVSERIIMEALATFFKGNLWLRTDGTRLDFSVAEVTALETALLHFAQFPLPSNLAKQFAIWEQFVYISVDRYHSGLRHSKGYEASLTSVLPKLYSLASQLRELKS